ncbi:MAG: peptidoglycan editing factor PgeF [Eubacteriales bacterium]|nr:peptidoglycan editing factor PgeF [Eubacteriales bacterium]
MNKNDISILKSIKYIDNRHIYDGIKAGSLADTTQINEDENHIPYIKFTTFEDIDFIRHGFSTRLGGVSSGIFESMNLAFNRDDNPELVLENFKRISKAIGTTPEKCVYSKQTHTTNVMRVGKKHCGMGVVRERDFDNIDGLVTNEPGVCLVTAYADCVPLFFIDRVNRCIGASHSGWRGTVSNITKSTLELMKDEFGTKPENVCAFIGPSICRSCYEVSEDVAVWFDNVYKKDTDRIVIPKGGGKYLLNLQMANYFNMIHEGILDKNIGISDICTCCNPRLLYSHRASKGKRGVLCGFIMIKESE